MCVLYAVPRTAGISRSAGFRRDSSLIRTWTGCGAAESAGIRLIPGFMGGKWKIPEPEQDQRVEG